MNKQRQSEIKAKLIVRNFECSPEEITQLLNICPTQIWRRGEPVTSRAKNVHKNNGWLLASPCDPVGSSIESQIDSLFSVVAPHADTFAKLPVGTNVELYCVMYVADYREPIIIFPSDTVKMLAKLGASVGIDIYDIREIQP
jgi:hypothetical protein